MSATTNPVFAGYQNDFEDVISRYSPVLFRVALRRLHNVEDAEDAVQDALLSAHKHIGQFEQRSQLSTWLTSIVTNVALMKLRRHSRYQTVSLDRNHEEDGAAFANELKDTSPTPDTIYARKERDEILQRAMAQLSPKLRSAIQLCDLEGFSIQDVSSALGISANTLKSRISRARARLGLALGKITGTRPTAGATSVVNRKAIVRRNCSSSGHVNVTVAAADPAAVVALEPGIRVCQPGLALARVHEIHEHSNVQMERIDHWYPQYSLQTTTQHNPQGCAT